MAGRQANKILVAISNESEGRTALRLALALADAQAAALSIVSVFRDLSLPKSFPSKKRVEVGELREIAQEAERKRVAKILKDLEQDTRELEHSVAFGNPYLEILEHAQKVAATLVVKESAPGTEARHASGFGSTAMQLFRHCPLPTLVVRPRKRRAVSRVLVALDVGDTDALHDQLNQKILAEAKALSNGFGAELCVCTAWQLEGESLFRSPRIGLSELELEQLLADEREARKKALSKALQAVGIPENDCTMLIHKGRPEEVIRELLDEEKIDVLVIGTVARSRLSGLLIGNTAERLLREVECSVLAIKP